MRLRGWVVPGVVGLALAGCGGTAPYANDPRPPALTTITAALTPHAIRLSPATLGAGPTLLILSNLTPGSQEVTISAAALQVHSGPINPGGTATLKLDLRPGTYDVSGTTGSAQIVVSGTRPSAQHQLLLP